MKMRRILAGLAAAAVACAATAISASAAVTNANSEGSYVVSLNDQENWGAIKGVVVTITVADDLETKGGAGGAVVIQGTGRAWAAGSKEFGISGTGTATDKDQTSAKMNGKVATLTYDAGSAIFADALSDEKAWGQLCIQSYWGADFSVDNVQYLYAENTSASTTEPAADSTTEAPADTTTEALATTTAVAVAGTTTRDAEISALTTGATGATAVLTGVTGTSDSSNSLAPATNANKTTTAANKTEDKKDTTGNVKTGDAGVGIAAAALAMAAATAIVARKKH